MVNIGERKGKIDNIKGRRRKVKFRGGKWIEFITKYQEDWSFWRIFEIRLGYLQWTRSSCFGIGCSGSLGVLNSGKKGINIQKLENC